MYCLGDQTPILFHPAERANQRGFVPCSVLYEERAEATALQRDQTKENALKQILSAEESSKDFEYLSLLRGKLKTGGLTSIIKVPTGQTDADKNPIYKEVFDQDDFIAEQCTGWRWAPLSDYTGVSREI